jgi:hypothetical protein
MSVRQWRRTGYNVVESGIMYVPVVNLVLEILFKTILPPSTKECTFGVFKKNKLFALGR